MTPPRHVDPLDELVLTVLSQHTSDLNAERAFASLREAFPTWDDVAAAPETRGRRRHPFRRPRQHEGSPDPGHPAGGVRP